MGLSLREFLADEKADKTPKAPAAGQPLDLDAFLADEKTEALGLAATRLGAATPRIVRPVAPTADNGIALPENPENRPIPTAAPLVPPPRTLAPAPRATPARLSVRQLPGGVSLPGIAPLPFTALPPESELSDELPRPLPMGRSATASSGRVAAPPYLPEPEPKSVLSPERTPRLTPPSTTSPRFRDGQTAQYSVEEKLIKELADLGHLSPEAAAPRSAVGRAAFAVGGMAAHPVETAKGIVLAPFDAAAMLGKFAGQTLDEQRGVTAARRADDPLREEFLNPVSRTDAAFAAAQLLTMGVSEKALPMLDKIFGQTMGAGVVDALRAGQSPRRAILAGYAKHVAAHTAAGAAMGAAFSKDDPEMGAILGGALAGVHAGRQRPHVGGIEHPDTYAAEVRANRQLGSGAESTVSDVRPSAPLTLVERLPEHEVRLRAKEKIEQVDARQTAMHQPPAPTPPSTPDVTVEANTVAEALAERRAAAAVPAPAEVPPTVPSVAPTVATPVATPELAPPVATPIPAATSPATVEAPTAPPAAPSAAPTPPQEYIPAASKRMVTDEQMIVRNVTHGLAVGNPDAIDRAAPEMATRVPAGAILVPLPDPMGSTASNEALAHAITVHTDATVAPPDFLERTAQVGDSRALRDKGQPGVTADEHEASLTATGTLPADRPVVLIDNLETTGAAAEGARRALKRPDATLVTYAKAPIPAGEVAATAKAPPKAKKPAPAAAPKEESLAAQLAAARAENATLRAAASAATLPQGETTRPKKKPTAGATDVGEAKTAAADAERVAPDAAAGERPGVRPAPPAVDGGAVGGVSAAAPQAEGTAKGETPARPAAAGRTAKAPTPQAGVAGAPAAVERNPVALKDRPHVAGPVGKTSSAHLPDGSRVKTRYRAIEADDLQASHDPFTFAHNPEYPEGVQGRAYEGTLGQANREHTIAETGKLDNRVLDAGSGLTDGPPLITPHGIAVAGNQRATMIKRAHSMAPEKAAAIRAELEQRAAEFGLDPDAIKAMRKPVLAREIIDDAVDTNDIETLSRLNQLSDQTSAKSKDALSAAVGRAKRLTEAGDALTHFTDTVGDETIRAYLSGGDGGQFVRKLFQDAVFSPQERGAFIDAKGAVTEAGKDAIEAALRMAAIGNVDIIHRTPPRIMRKLESAIPAIIQANATGEFALTKDLQRALDLLWRVDAARAAKAARGEPTTTFGVEQFLEQPQQDMFGAERVPPAVAELATFLERDTKPQITAALREYAKEATASEATTRLGDDMFGSTPATSPELRARLTAPKPKAAVEPPAGEHIAETTPSYEGERPALTAPGSGTSLTLHNGAESLTKYGLDPTQKRFNNREVAAALQARQRARVGMIDRADRSPASSARIAKWMAAEVRRQLETGSKAVGWYTQQFQQALDVMAERFPELRHDQDARDLFTALAAVTSDGADVMDNFDMAAGAYDNFKRTGQFTMQRGHARSASLDANMKNIQELHDQLGPRGMRDYLLEERPISVLRKIAQTLGKEVSGDYQAHIKMPRATVIFGPKLGAFYANLMGNANYLTMDRWWSRSFNRYRGTLLQTPTRSGLDRFKKLLKAHSISDEEAITRATEVRKPYVDRGFKKGTVIQKAANTVHKMANENLEDSPFNATDRTFMIETAKRAQASLKRSGHDISIADLQAVLWYYEKELYGRLTKKAGKGTVGVSYADAAESPVVGIDPKEPLLAALDKARVEDPDFLKKVLAVDPPKKSKPQPA